MKGAPILTGTFNAAARPTVRICKIASSAATTPGSAACVSTLVQFTSAEIQVSTTEEHFKVNWDTEKNPGAPSTYYRVLVNVSGLELGYADVYVASSSKDLKNANDETLATVDGRTVPLKFSIRQGATSAAHDPTFQCNDCVEKTVPANTPTNIVTPSGRAAAAMPALRDELTVTINRITTSATSPCLPLPASIQADGCYDYDAFANGQLYTANFKAPDGTDTFARVEICLDPAKSLDDYQLHKFSPARASEGVVALPRAASSLTTCPTSGPLYGWRSDGNRLRDLAHFGLEMIRPVARLIGPAVLHAEDPGAGGAAGSFSNIGWARPITVEIAPGSNQQAAVGGTKLAQGPKVRVLTGRHTPVGAANFTVNFAVTSGGGTVGASAVTDAHGYASVPWVIGTGPGENSVVATLNGVAQNTSFASATFTATSQPGVVVINDVNPFNTQGMASANNVTLLHNLIAYTGTGPRASSTKVLWDRGRNTPCGPTSSTCNNFGTFTSSLPAGYTLQEISSSFGSLTSITSDVKVIFLWLPRVTFTVDEINALKQFVAEGGRLVVVGEWENFLGPAGKTAQNNLLSGLGAGAQNAGLALDCFNSHDLPAQTGAHQVTVGVTHIRMSCASTLQLAAGDVPLLYNGGINTQDGSPSPAANTHVLAAVVKINTTPLTVSSTSASRGVRGGLGVSRSTTTTTCDSGGRCQ